MKDVLKITAALTAWVALILLVFGTNGAYAADIYYDAENNAIIYDGEIEIGDYDKFVDVHKANPKADYVLLWSQGGNVSESYKLVEYIRDNELHTFAPGLCASACTTVFMGGINRVVTEDTQMMYHYAWAPEEALAEYTYTTVFSAGQQEGMISMYVIAYMLHPADVKDAMLYYIELNKDTTATKLNTADNDKLVKVGIATHKI